MLRRLASVAAVEALVTAVEDRQVARRGSTDWGNCRRYLKLPHISEDVWDFARANMTGTSNTAVSASAANSEDKTDGGMRPLRVLDRAYASPVTLDAAAHRPAVTCNICKASCCRNCAIRTSVLLEETMQTVVWFVCPACSQNAQMQMEGRDSRGDSSSRFVGKHAPLQLPRRNPAVEDD